MTREMPKVPSSLWASDRGLLILLVTLIAIIVVPAFETIGLPGTLIADVLASLMLVSGAAAVSDRPQALVIVAVIAVAALLVRWASWLFPAADLAVWREASTLTAVVALCWVVLALVLRPGPITARRIEGAIAVYLLLGFGWWHAYELVSLWHPGAFAGAVDSAGSPPLMYYSFVTLTTMGYGDIMPVHPLLARSQCSKH
jgi:hypothetical protein